MSAPAGAPDAFLSRRAWAVALLAAVALTGLDALKPLVVDDPVYVAYARQIASHPLDPYGFEIFWYDAPEPAMRIGTVPAVLPYWLGAAIALCGEHPVAWKLSLLPFALALTSALAFLLDRFARPFATPLLFVLALGPAVLPGFNLMLDVPAVALGLQGFALFLRGGEGGGRTGATVASGLALALAMQTKYSAVVYAALVGAAALLSRRRRDGLLALALAAAVFVGWEALLVARYGQSHFLAGIERLQARDNLEWLSRADARTPGTSALYWILSLLTLLGGTAGAAGLLGAVGLGARRRSVTGAALAAAAAFAAIPFLPQPPAFQTDAFFAKFAAINPSVLLLLPLGLAVALVLLLAARRALRGDGAELARGRLLVAWLAIELAGFFLISPYPVVRRVIGLGIAAALLGAQLASRRAAEPDVRAGLRVATAFGLALAALYFGADLADARSRRALLEAVLERLPPESAGRRWYTGHWEAQYYLERAGLRPAIVSSSRLQPGDWLVLFEGVDRPQSWFPADHLRRVDQLVARSAWPWSTMPRYYGSPVPLRRQPPHQAVARLYQVTQEVEPQPRVSPAPRGGASARPSAGW
ncbi:MAG TPA: hypothetical protein VMW19_12895 [Myxococcota bacterium]|nr:hypothetical protein [Myxococcota bacterium]